MTQGNDGFADPLRPPSGDACADPSLDLPRDPSPDPSQDLSGDPLSDAWREPWRGPWRDQDVVRRSGHGEAVFTHGPAPTGGDRRAADAVAPQGRELPVIQVPAAAAPPGSSPRPRTSSRASRAGRAGSGARRGIVSSGVPTVVLATLGIFGLVGVAGLAAVGKDEPMYTSIEGVAPAGPDYQDVPPVDDGTQFAATPVRLRLPAAPIALRASPDYGDVTIESDACSVEDATSSGERRDLAVVCADALATRTVFVIVPEGTPLTLVGGTRLTVAGDLGSLAVDGSTADVNLDEVFTDALRVATSGEVTGRIRGASTVDVLSRSGRVDLTFLTPVTATTIKAPRGEVAVQVPPGTYDLDLRAGTAGVSSALPDSPGAEDTLAITTTNHPITVTTER